MPKTGPPNTFDPDPEVVPKTFEVLLKGDETPVFPKILGVDDELTIWLKTDCPTPELEELANIPVEKIKLSKKTHP